MKLSMASSSLNYYLETGVDRRTGMKALRDCGFTCVDYEVTDSMLGEDLVQCAEETKAMLAELGLTAPQGHAPMYNPLNPPEGVDCLDLYTRTLRFCKIVGIPHVVIHPGAVEGNTREEFFERNAAFYKSLIPAAEETGVGVLIENIGHYANPYYLWNGADLRQLIDMVDHPLFTACWDVGHANLFYSKDCNQYDSIIALGDKLTALHVHDNCGYFSETYRQHRIDNHTIPFASCYTSVSFDAVLQGLKDIGYQGTFNFETLFPAKKFVSNFTYHDEKVRTLQILPLELWQKFNAVVYDMGKYMLETYGLYEE